MTKCQPTIFVFQISLKDWVNFWQIKTFFVVFFLMSVWKRILTKSWKLKMDFIFHFIFSFTNSEMSVYSNIDKIPLTNFPGVIYRFDDMLNLIALGSIVVAKYHGGMPHRLLVRCLPFSPTWSLAPLPQQKGWKMQSTESVVFWFALQSTQSSLQNKCVFWNEYSWWYYALGKKSMHTKEFTIFWQSKALSNVILGIKNYLMWYSSATKLFFLPKAIMTLSLLFLCVILEGCIYLGNCHMKSW